MKNIKNNLFPLLHKNSSYKSFNKTISTTVNSKISNNNVSGLSKNEFLNNIKNTNKIYKKQNIFEKTNFKKYELNSNIGIKLRNQESSIKKIRRRNILKKELKKCNSCSNVKFSLNNLNIKEERKSIKEEKENKNKKRILKNNSCGNLNRLKKSLKKNKIEINEENLNINYINENHKKVEKKINTKIKEPKEISPKNNTKILLFDDSKLNLSKLKFAKFIDSKIIKKQQESNDENSSFSQFYPIETTERPIPSIHNLNPTIKNKLLILKKVNNNEKDYNKISEREYDLNELKILLTGKSIDDLDFFNKKCFQIPNKKNISEDEIIPIDNNSLDSEKEEKNFTINDFIKNNNIQIQFTEKYDILPISINNVLIYYNNENYLWVKNCVDNFNFNNNEILGFKYKLIFKNIYLCKLLLNELLDFEKDKNDLKQKKDFLLSLFYENVNLGKDIQNTLK